MIDKAFIYGISEIIDYAGVVVIAVGAFLAIVRLIRDLVEMPAAGYRRRRHGQYPVLTVPFGPCLRTRQEARSSGGGRDDLSVTAVAAPNASTEQRGSAPDPSPTTRALELDDQEHPSA